MVLLTKNIPIQSCVLHNGGFDCNVGESLLLHFFSTCEPMGWYLKVSPQRVSSLSDFIIIQYQDQAKWIITYTRKLWELSSDSLCLINSDFYSNQILAR